MLNLMTQFQIVLEKGLLDCEHASDFCGTAKTYYGINTSKPWNPFPTRLLFSMLTKRRGHRRHTLRCYCFSTL
jgi:hypothetical protein